MPHLRELVKLHQDRPFALIGINTGDSPEDYRKGLEDHGVSWISAYQGEETPIADMYRVRGYPTYFLIDADGKIVMTGHSGSAMDDKIEELLEKAEAKK
ncbi:MAG: TlpA family protein disulfide reductase [Planctomycetes bacterium]|jgi:thioredoxin-related protein|nr:TlpA family protein disulfide reductase [Planctomycetota bacterium]